MGLDSFMDIFGGAAAHASGCACEDLAFAKQYPTLYRLLTCTMMEEGKPRQVCTLTVICEDGVVKAGLRERTLGLSLWTSSQSILEVFTALEEALAQRPAGWRKLPEKWKGR
jgi:hypothetical protein